ncbi:MAG: cupin domain-containing protein [Thermoanaerobaculia bacterium]
MKKILLYTAFLLVGIAAGTLGANDAATAEEAPAAMAHHLVVQTGDIAWGPIPPKFPAGGEIAVLQGDPFSEGFYVVRVRMPDGYRILPHWHPTAENVTVISGTIHIAAGDAFDKKAGDAVKAGGYVSLPGLMHHFAWAEGATEIQIHGIGPFAIYYLNPADDPSHTQK